MFESLSDRLAATFRSLSGRAALSEENIREGLREVRLALLEADVNFQVVKSFVDKVRDQVIGLEVTRTLTPTQQLIKVVHDELVELLGTTAAAGLDLRGASVDNPTLVMLVGLQGSGKTTSAAKLANFLRKGKTKPYLIPLDVYRPAAIEQLRTLARQLDIPCFATEANSAPADILRAALAEAKELQCTALILDTAGRLQIDEPLMQELVDLKTISKAQEILFVADAMTGQEAVNVASSFHERLGLTGVVLTKMDGDARGGAALSIKAVLGVQVKFVGMGEKTSEWEVFYPERVAGRILGMGDMLTLIEKAQDGVAEEEALAMSKKLQKASFDFEDFRTQMRRVKQIGSLESIMKMIPGLGGLASKLGDMHMPEKELQRTEAIINSMTKFERKNPDAINPSRKQRIAKGSGTTVAQVNQLLRQFDQMKKMMKTMLAPKAKGTGRPGMGGLGGLGNGLGGLGALGGGLGGLGGGLGGLGGGLGGLGGLGNMLPPGMGGGPGSGKSATKKKKPERQKRKNKKR